MNIKMTTYELIPAQESSLARPTCPDDHVSDLINLKPMPMKTSKCRQRIANLQQQTSKCRQRIDNLQQRTGDLRKQKPKREMQTDNNQYLTSTAGWPEHD